MVVTIISARRTDENSITSARRTDTSSIIIAPAQIKILTLTLTLTSGQSRIEELGEPIFLFLHLLPFPSLSSLPSVLSTFSSRTPPLTIGPLNSLAGIQFGATILLIFISY